MRLSRDSIRYKMISNKEVNEKKEFCMERSILLKYLKILLNKKTNLNIILFDYQNNYVEHLNVHDNTVNSFNILAT